MFFLVCSKSTYFKNGKDVFSLRDSITHGIFYSWTSSSMSTSWSLAVTFSRPQIQSLFIHLETFAMHNVFFFDVSCEKSVKTWKYSFRLQKGVEIGNELNFWKHQALIINQSALGYRAISPWKYLQSIMCFFNVLCGNYVKT